MTESWERRRSALASHIWLECVWVVYPAVQSSALLTLKKKFKRFINFLYSGHYSCLRWCLWVLGCSDRSIFCTRRDNKRYCSSKYWIITQQTLCRMQKRIYKSPECLSMTGENVALKQWFESVTTISSFCSNKSTLIAWAAPECH